MGRLTEKVIALLNRRRGAQAMMIAIEPEGLALSLVGNPASRRVLRWDAIERIVVFKRDLYAHDQIGMAIETTQHSVVELSEAMAGWQELTGTLRDHLPSALPAEAWFMKVAFPAFKPSPVEIYRRKAG